VKRPPQSANGVIQDCWKQIGVYGDDSCPALEEHVHCRNCPVFSSAAERLLDRELPATDIARWTADVAAVRKARAADTHSAVVFRVGPEWLALPSALFEEVADPRPIHALPHRRNEIVLGVANIRGELRVCVSLAKLLKIEAGAEPRKLATRGGRGYPRLLVIQREGSRVATPVDEVHGVRRYNPQNLREVPATLAHAAAFTRSILDWEQVSVGMLDDQLLFYAIDRSLA
jgi:chemotaxis-related protein WspD